MGFSDISAERESSKERGHYFLHNPQRFITPTQVFDLTSCNSTLILISSCSHAACDLLEAYSVIETTKLGCLERVFFSVPTLVDGERRGRKCPHHLQTHRYSDLSSERKGQPGSTCQPCELELSMIVSR